MPRWSASSDLERCLPTLDSLPAPAFLCLNFAGTYTSFTLCILYILISPFLTRLPYVPHFLLITGHTPELSYHASHTHSSTFKPNCRTIRLTLHTEQLAPYIHVLHHCLHHALLVSLVTCLYTDLVRGSVLITLFAAPGKYLSRYTLLHLTQWLSLLLPHQSHRTACSNKVLCDWLDALYYSPQAPLMFPYTVYFLTCVYWTVHTSQTSHPTRLWGTSQYWFFDKVPSSGSHRTCGRRLRQYISKTSNVLNSLKTLISLESMVLKQLEILFSFKTYF